ncbi:hypothetical protein E3P77_01013 [Wallemia ichthyophaga]|uniref:HTH APSES-type domain-containing protein n=1 Tax=Wallemia ichthyophaga TaxID=245174 RepID=A0A4T0LGU5_WALIC|nr:hypothetical protein E3P98_01204 [Wallemia ichthyophaga]TIB12648.1 hypothetical protein E3P93_02222 [Wallemia ichthyophaga]TIB14926.1 hypothetical protein E3P90_01091 [Wallemia ichthyophaga]TIB24763.1 hypothetical protein E3P89_00796 [Wallemia ichthyophaga]TIB26539.1 hypothetical protein E3P88_00960 [Wallemia ichthyophaga]
MEMNKLNNPASPTTPHPPSTKKPAKPAPRIYSAVYSGVGVYEAMIRGIAVMRRRADGYMNATQILKVAGVDKGKRTKILEREILAGLHEKIQGGYGKYQGTWIPFERGRELAAAYSSEHLLAPIFDFDPAAVSSAGGRTAKSPNKRARAQNDVTHTQTPASTHKTPSPLSPTSTLHHNSLLSLHNARTSGIYVGGVDDPNDDGLGRKEVVPHTHSSNSKHPTLHKKPYQPPPGTSAQILTRTQHALTSLFQAPPTDTLPDSIAILDPTNGALHPDLAIDELGHTALHWAASLGRVATVRHLLSKRCDGTRGNIAGETPLERSVLVVDSYERRAFSQLLHLLADTIRVVDRARRTVLHHIALISAVAGRAASARYYMETLLEYVARCEQGDYSSLVDVQDEHGDTALNIAARVGNRHLVQMLVDAGANTTTPNKLGLKAGDFGVVEVSRGVFEDYHSYALFQSLATSSSSSQEVSQFNPNTQSHTHPSADEMLANLHPPPPVHVDSSTHVMRRLEGVLSDLDRSFGVEVAAKNKLLFEIQADLKQHSHELADVRKEIAYWETKATQRAELEQKVRNVEEAIANEGVGVWTLKGESTQDVEGAKNTEHNSEDLKSPWETDVMTSSAQTPDTPETLHHLQKLHRWMNGTQKLTEERVASIDGLSASKEVKYKSIVSVCTGVPEEQVEGMLGELLEAVESDASADMSKVNEFLARHGN